jgi:hypothetical protein
MALEATDLAGWDPRRLQQPGIDTSEGTKTSWREAAWTWRHDQAAAEPASGEVEPKTQDGAQAQKAIGRA